MKNYKTLYPIFPFGNNSFLRSFEIIFFVLNFIFLIPQYHLHSQTAKILFEHYTTDQGLSASIVRSIIQDKTSYLWFGTYSGLDRYDGAVFKSYKNIPGDTLSITNGFVQCLLEDKAGNLWIGTTNGLDKLERSTETFNHYKPYDKSSANEWNNNIFSIQEDLNGVLWLGTGDGLNKFDPITEKFTHFKHDTLNRSSLNHNVIYAILLDKRGALWVGTGNGLDKFDPETGNFIHYWENIKYKPGFFYDWYKSKYWITELYEDEDGIIWIGTQGGLLEFEPEKERFTHYEYDPKNSESISFYGVTSICKENPDALWIGTWNGLNLFDKKTKKFRRIYHDANDSKSVSHNSIAFVFRERSGTLWVSTYGEGVNKANRTVYPFKQYGDQNWKKIQRFSSASIMDLHESKNDLIWVATPTGLKMFYPKEEILKDLQISENIRTVEEDSKGNLWIAFNNSSGRGFFKYDKNKNLIPITDSKKNKLPWLVNEIVEYDNSTLWLCTEDRGAVVKINTTSSIFISAFETSTTLYAIHKDNTGLLWIGSREDGLICFDPAANKIVDHFRSDPKNPKSISGNTILTIYEDKNNNFWLGTNIGLNKFERIKKEFYHFTESNGLPRNWVYLIFEDSKRDIWVNTLKGISKFIPSSQTFKNYDVLHGIVSADRSGVGCQAANGEIYLVSSAGLTRFHPDSISDNPYIPPVVITNISIAGKTIPFSEQINLSHDDNNMSFEFAALSYVRPEKNLYAYRLEGIDKDWIYSATLRYASYTNLKPGEYNFRVKGSNNDGVWNEQGASIKIIIYPPWWKTLWAYIIYSLLLINVIFFTWKFRLQRVRNKHEFEMSRFEAQKLHEVDEIKTRFFTNISHEFRTPLTLILGPAKQLLERFKDDKSKEQLDLIQRSAKKLNRLVDELLDISKIEAGEMKLKACPINLVSFVKKIILSFHAFAERKKITFPFSSDDDEIIAYIDKDKIDKILTNVLSNAFKFTPEGGKVEVTIKPTPRPFQGGDGTVLKVPSFGGDLLVGKKSKINDNYVEIFIRDTGIGIPQDQLDKIFDRFYQVDGSHTKAYGGTGIGLALTKELIELHKGRIEVESEEGKGSTFRLIFPLGKSQLKEEEICEDEKCRTGDKDEDEDKEKTCQLQPKADKLADEDKDKEDLDTQSEVLFEIEDRHKIDIQLAEKAEKPSLLIVEDNADVRKYISMIFENRYKIMEAEDGEEGLKKAFESSTGGPDLIITDIMMPKMDGFQLCSKLKTDSRTSHIPVIMLTAKATMEDKISGLEIGADEYIMKPFEADELKARIKNLLEQRKRLHQHFRQHGLFESAEGGEEKNITPVDKNFLEKSFAIITEHISDTSFGVEILAENMNVSRSILLKKIEALIGESPLELIKRTRLNTAAKLIEKNFGNVSEVALEVGFNNPSYFAECFKKQFGVSPSQYHNKS